MVTVTVANAPPSVKLVISAEIIKGVAVKVALGPAAGAGPPEFEAVLAAREMLTRPVPEVGATFTVTVRVVFPVPLTSTLLTAAALPAVTVTSAGAKVMAVASV